MCNKVIFLDLDGVLNVEDGIHSTFFKYKDLYFEPELVERFNSLIERLPENVKIVISSSWRTDMEDLEECLKDAGFLHWDRVIGKTPSIKSGSRFNEIIKYLELNKKVKRFIIIDDYPHNMPEPLVSIKVPHGALGAFVKTDPRHGLEEKHCEYIENKLGGDA